LDQDFLIQEFMLEEVVDLVELKELLELLEQVVEEQVDLEQFLVLEQQVQLIPVVVVEVLLFVILLKPAVQESLS
jgi:hypothetical protein